MAEQRKALWRRWWGRGVALCLILFIVAELFTRFYLGLGDPPLSVADPEIEYLFAPSQEVRWLGHRIHYNAWSMRSEDFAEHKTDPRELRVMVLGDSVINGGGYTDQSELATEVLRTRLSKKLGQPVIVGNISAGTWGPPNLLAYVKRFGLFDADVVVIVLSSHDYADVPTFAPVVGVSPNFPDHKPILALQELVVRGILPRLRHSAASGDLPADAPAKPSDIAQCLGAIGELIDCAQASGAAVIVARHLETREQTGNLLPGHDLIGNVAGEHGAEVIDLGPSEKALLDSGKNPNRDGIHPNALGQKVIADVLFEPIEKVLVTRVRMGATSLPAH